MSPSCLGDSSSYHSIGFGAGKSRIRLEPVGPSHVIVNARMVQDASDE
jgi:hypothetical protein